MMALAGVAVDHRRRSADNRKKDVEKTEVGVDKSGAVVAEACARRAASVDGPRSDFHKM